MGSLHVKFHDDRCKGKAVMRRKPFSVIYALWPWPLTLKSIGHILASWGVCMWSFMMIVVKGKQLCAGNPNAAGQTDRRTDMVIPVYPPNFVAGGIIRLIYRSGSIRRNACEGIGEGAAGACAPALSKGGGHKWVCPPPHQQFWTDQVFYRITGIFCGCLIFAEFCGSIEIAEIENRKIFQSRYNDEIVSEVIVQSRIFRCLSGNLYCAVNTVI